VLDPAAQDGARVWLQCKVQDGVPLAVAALRCGGAEAQPLDLILDQYAEFTVQGPSPVHVTGAETIVREAREGISCMQQCLRTTTHSPAASRWALPAIPGVHAQLTNNVVCPYSLPSHVTCFAATASDPR
jgi:hypothetical protein